MAIGVFCGVVPFIFRRKPSEFKEEDTRKTRRLHSRVIKKLPSILVSKKYKAAKGSKVRNSCGVKTPKAASTLHNSSVAKTTKSPTFHNSCGVASNFRIMTDIRNKILSLRELLDLSPCDGSESANELLISTLRDLHKLYPSINPNFSLAKIDGTAILEKVRCFCDILKSIGEMWTGNDEWMIKCKENSHSKLNDFEFVSALLGDIIKLASERMIEMTDDDEDDDEDEHEDEYEDTEDDQTRDRSPSPDAFEEDIEDDQTRDRSPSPDTFEKDFSECYSSNNSSLSSSPTSILPEIITNASKKNAKASIAAPLRLSLKVQAVGKKNPVEVKHLSFHMFPNVNQDSNIEAKQDFEYSQDCEIVDLPEILLTNLENLSENSGIYWTGASNGQPMQARVTFDVFLPPSSISKLQSNVAEQTAVPPSPYILSPKIIESQGPTTPAPDSALSPESEESTPSSPAAQPTTSGNSVTPPPPPPPPPPPTTSKNRAVPPPPLPPPRKSEIVHSSPPPLSPHKGLRGMVTSHPLPPRESNGATPAPVPAPPSPKPIGKVAAPPPPPMPMGKRATPPPSPPPPMPMKKGGAPPPPPPVFAGAKNPRLKKAATKLKRSSQMGNLYRSLRGKVEGSSLDGKSKGGKGKFNAASKGGKPGMADALAEMTKRSAYFQQIEEDVRNHAKTIMEMKKAIASFHTSDMSELVRFHNYVELHLEKLTDESQVLARFEDFPFKKLEALRTAATLYSKLDTIVCTLQSWQPASPVSQHLARAERYFNKIKGDVDSLERTKDEESKKLKTHKIHFDFSILVSIKELMVDVSSNCMELAIKEKREAKAKEKDGAATTNEGCKKESAQLLWKAFQFAFRVYTFAGGHDERAEKLTKELAEEIETGLHR